MMPETVSPHNFTGTGLRFLLLCIEPMLYRVPGLSFSGDHYGKETAIRRRR
jgi:hypothetical protein